MQYDVLKFDINHSTFLFFRFASMQQKSIVRMTFSDGSRGYSLIRMLRSYQLSVVKPFVQNLKQRKRTLEKVLGNSRQILQTLPEQQLIRIAASASWAKEAVRWPWM